MPAAVGSAPARLRRRDAYASAGNNTAPTTAPDLRLSLAVMDGEKKKLRLSFGYLILGLWAVLLVQQVLSAYLRPNRISYSDFKAAVAQNQVEETAIGKTLIQGRMKEGAAAQPAPTPSQPQAPSAKPSQPLQPPQPPTKADGGGKSRAAFETIRVDDVRTA